VNDLKKVMAWIVYDLGRVDGYLQREDAIASGMDLSKLTFALGDDVQAKVSTAFEDDLNRGFLDGIALSVAMDDQRFQP